ncbi:hypothetical protein IWQ61_009743 [Dispira simplex]|nr:hypothetical protein IWQ61_009743 [Dispira simplex]
MESTKTTVTKEQLAEMVEQLTMQVAALETKVESQVQTKLPEEDVSVGAKVMGREPPKFSVHPGENLLLWERRIELYYFSRNIQGKLRVTLASEALEGAALRWYLDWLLVRTAGDLINLPTWEEFIHALKEKFGTTTLEQYY